MITLRKPARQPDGNMPVLLFLARSRRTTLDVSGPHAKMQRPACCRELLLLPKTGIDLDTLRAGVRIPD